MALSNQAEVNLALLGTLCIINAYCDNLKYMCVCVCVSYTKTHS